jgi:proteasome lid subunit RPN8/RPN11
MENNQKIKVIIEPKVTKVIEYFCQRMTDIEWSGTVFYEINSIRNPSKAVVRVKDIFLQGIGSAAYTESDFDGDLFKYAREKKLMDYTKGIIHSHNKMRAYFSGTDVNELKENCVHHNIYLSLVVNNNLDVVATIYQRKYTAKAFALDHKGDKYEVPMTNIQQNIVDYTVYECDAIMEGKTPSPFPEWEAQIEAIINKRQKGTIEEKLEKKKGKKEEYGSRGSQMALPWHDQQDDFQAMYAHMYPKD